MGLLPPHMQKIATLLVMLMIMPSLLSGIGELIENFESTEEFSDDPDPMFINYASVARMNGDTTFWEHITINDSPDDIQVMDSGDTNICHTPYSADASNYQPRSLTDKEGTESTIFENPMSTCLLVAETSKELPAPSFTVVSFEDSDEVTIGITWASSHAEDGNLIYTADATITDMQWSISCSTIEDQEYACSSENGVFDLRPGASAQITADLRSWNGDNVVEGQSFTALLRNMSGEDDALPIYDGVHFQVNIGDDNSHDNTYSDGLVAKALGYSVDTSTQPAFKVVPSMVTDIPIGLSGAPDSDTGRCMWLKILDSNNDESVYDFAILSTWLDEPNSEFVQDIKVEADSLTSQCQDAHGMNSIGLASNSGVLPTPSFSIVPLRTVTVDTYTIQLAYATMDDDGWEVEVNDLFDLEVVSMAGLATNMGDIAVKGWVDSTQLDRSMGMCYCETDTGSLIRFDCDDPMPQECEAFVEELSDLSDTAGRGGDHTGASSTNSLGTWYWSLLTTIEPPPLELLPLEDVDLVIPGSGSNTGPGLTVGVGGIFSPDLKIDLGDSGTSDVVIMVVPEGHDILSSTGYAMYDQEKGWDDYVDDAARGGWNESDISPGPYWGGISKTEDWPPTIDSGNNSNATSRSSGPKHVTVEMPNGASRYARVVGENTAIIIPPSWYGSAGGDGGANYINDDYSYHGDGLSSIDLNNLPDGVVVSSVDEDYFDLRTRVLVPGTDFLSPAITADADAYAGFFRPSTIHLVPGADIIIPVDDFELPSGEYVILIASGVEVSTNEFMSFGQGWDSDSSHPASFMTAPWSRMRVSLSIAPPTSPEVYLAGGGSDCWDEDGAVCTIHTAIEDLDDMDDYLEIIMRNPSEFNAEVAWDVVFEYPDGSSVVFADGPNVDRFGPSEKSTGGGDWECQSDGDCDLCQTCVNGQCQWATIVADGSADVCLPIQVYPQTEERQLVEYREEGCDAEAIACVQNGRGDASLTILPPPASRGVWNLSDFLTTGDLIVRGQGGLDCQDDGDCGLCQVCVDGQCQWAGELLRDGDVCDVSIWADPLTLSSSKMLTPIGQDHESGHPVPVFMRTGQDELPDSTTRSSGKYWYVTYFTDPNCTTLTGDSPCETTMSHMMEVTSADSRVMQITPHDIGNVHFDVSTMKDVMANANVGDDFTISIYPRAIDCESDDPCSNPLKIVYIVDEPAADISSADSDGWLPGFSVITLLAAVGAAASMISRRRNQYEEI